MRLAALTERLAARKPFHGSEIQNLKFERFSTGFRGNHGFRQNEAQRFLRLERFFNPWAELPSGGLGRVGWRWDARAAGLELMLRPRREGNLFPII